MKKHFFPFLATFLLSLISSTKMNAQNQDQINSDKTKLPLVKSENPLAHTYSIVAYDPATKQLGVAVQSHWFSVGPLVVWGEAGVGAIATQSFVNPDFGPDGLALLKEGLSPQQAIDSLTKVDEGRDFRQLAIVNAKGEVAAFTGQNCIEAAGHVLGKNYSCQANLMLNNKVWPAMAEAYEKSIHLPLQDRMLLALEAAENAGGDIRGKQSVAMLVLSGNPSGTSWKDKLVDLRVEDHPEPLKEMRRLLTIHKAYDHMNKGDVATEKGDLKSAMMEYGQAQKLNPDNLEMRYWHAIALVNTGQINQALPIFKDIFKQDENWRTLTPRLLPSKLLEVDEKQLQMILAQ